MKFSAIALGLAALVSATAMAAPVEDVAIEAREANAELVEAANTLQKRMCSICTGKRMTCCSVGGFCYITKC